MKSKQGDCYEKIITNCFTIIIDCWGFIRSNETKEEQQIRINQKWNDKNKVAFEYVN